VTRAAAANFYYGIRLLPREKRDAMSAVYAFARRIDDIGDGTLQPAAKVRELELACAQLRELSADSEDPVLVALADAHARYTLPLDALEDLIDGVRMDLDAVRYQSFEELVVYCRRVAGSIGRLCLAIFGARELSRAWSLADDLGVALQLTNILRDVREDAENGRVYLPGADLERFGVISAGELEQAPPLLAALCARAGTPPARRARYADDGDHSEAQLWLDALVRLEAARAREWFQRGLSLVELLDRRSAACVLAMSGIYARLLDRIEADPRAARQQRLSLPITEKAWVAARSLLGGARA
jgi:phytoene synthase